MYSRMNHGQEWQLNEIIKVNEIAKKNGIREPIEFVSGNSVYNVKAKLVR
jgi:hypothetical protein